MAANRENAAPQTPAGGYGIRPYGLGENPAVNRKPNPAVHPV